ncbi:SGNH/GDSL hydrolase family protein [Tropicimonas marinistellae]|uniref:SGNH/GDSL hydrolase family protein n=1 Tax=Tropicimonas marinistellae TaxID=1739787 RepID=UPI0008339D9A|nr:SGNH/GDSL hydrolase family protein [Tropicimonas marinistellae]
MPHTKTIFDTDESRPWVKLIRTFDGDGALIFVEKTFDDGRVALLTFSDGVRVTAAISDAADEFPWAEKTRTFDDDGTLLTLETVFDDGRLVAATFENGVRTSKTITDLANAFSWTSKIKTFDDDGTLSTFEKVFDDGRTIATTFENGTRLSKTTTDSTGLNGWTEQVETFDTDGKLATRERTYEDGRVAEDTYVAGVRTSRFVTDVADAYDWETKSVTYNADGTISGQTTTYGDGGSGDDPSGPDPVDTDPGTPDADGDTGGPGEELSFSGTDAAVVVDLSARTFSYAATVMPLGDSLTVGWINGTEDPDTREGYRLDFFENVIAAGGWIDYVGGDSTGPSDLMDTDNAAQGGEALWEVIKSDGVSGPADISDAASTYSPDIALMMLGTNDIPANNFPVKSNGNDALGTRMKNLATAVEQFFENAGSDATLVVSTIAPRIDSGRAAILSEYFNQGYSVVAGEIVVGDAENDTYVPGLIATIEGLQETYSSLLLFENPHAIFDSIDDAEALDHLSSDGVHWSQAAYADYADALFAFVDSEIGLTAGTLGGTAQVVDAKVTDLYGSDAGDRLTGDAADNVLNGGAGSDLLEGGHGADTFVFDRTALATDTYDRITDFNAAEGDVVDVSAIAAYLGVGQSAFDLTATSAGVRLTVTDGGASYHLATFSDITLTDISLSSDFILGGG